GVSGLPQQLGKHAFEEWFRAAFQHVVGGLQANCSGFGCVRLRFGVAQHQSRDSVSMSSHELKQDVAANRYSDEDCASYASIVQNAGKIRRVFFHRSWPFADARSTVSAKIGQNEAIAPLQRLRHRQPKLMMNRKRMEQNHRRAVAKYLIEDFGVAALN